MYTVYFWKRAVNCPNATPCKTKAEVNKVMVELIDANKQALQKAGYQRIGSVKEGLIQWRHPIYGVEESVRLKKD